ncbi:MAG TPA: cupin domain-containing protein [Candidatus Dormibacteraeota bacterium]|nr:cupin domain-containing protein [Candidatus Dormibacteraeota bacterium]
MTRSFVAMFLGLVAFMNPRLMAQTPPRIPAGYATEGRKAATSQFQTAPGFVDVSSLDLLPWQDVDFSGTAKGMKTKILSRDEKRGAVTLLTYAPMRYVDQERGYHTADEDIFVLEGDLTIGDQKLLKYSYTFVPAGMVHGPVSSRGGALFLEWFNQKPDFVKSNDNAPGARAYAAVRDWNYYKAPWTIDFPPFRKDLPALGARLKLLRRDPDTGEMLWINAAIQVRQRGLQARQGLLWEVHPTFEEHFVLEYSGDMVVDECLPSRAVANKWPDRSYHYRPAQIPHLILRTGFGLILCHTGGPLWADYYKACPKGGKVPVPR